jgi:hypothetical protein
MRKTAVSIGLALIVIIAIAYLIINATIAVVEGIMALVVLAVIIGIGYLVLKASSRR